MRQWLARQPLQYLEPALERPLFAVCELADAAFQRRVGRRRSAELVSARFGQPQLQPAAIGGIGLAIDQAGTNQCIDRPADGRRAPPDPGRDLVQCSRLGFGNRGEQVALLSHRLGRSGIPAKLLDQPSEARRKGAR